MRSRWTLLWKAILPACALKGRKVCAQVADARVRELGKQALSDPFAGMKAPLKSSRRSDVTIPEFIDGAVCVGSHRDSRWTSF